MKFRKVRRAGLATLVLLLVAGLLPTTAIAARPTGPRTLSVSWGAPSNPPSLNPQPPADDTEPYLHVAAISYDAATGTVTGRFSLYDSAYWTQHIGDFPNGLGIDLATDCSDSPPQPGQSAEGTGWNGVDLTLGMQAVSDGASPGYDTVQGSASLSSYQGQVTGTGSFDGTTYTVIAQSPYFAGRDFRCAYFSPSSPDQDAQGWEWLMGWAPVHANSTNMSAAFDAALAGRAVIPRVEGPACPAVEVKTILQGYASCFAEYRWGGRWHLASGGVKEVNGDLRAKIAHTSSWRRRWTVCRETGWRVRGTNLVVPGARRNTLVSNNGCGQGEDVYFVEQEMIWGCGPGSLPNRGGCHVGAREVGWQFTDSAGFDSIGIYRCKRRHLEFTCTNRVGDSFRYRA